MSSHKVERVDEVWKIIPNFSKYEVSNKGQIRRKSRSVFHKGANKDIELKEKIMKQRWNKLCKCFFMDLLNDGNKRKTVYPHKEVANAYCINVLPVDFTMIVHLDNNSKNNDSTNLEWVSPSEHMAFQFEVGNKDNFKVWRTRKRKYKNGFKPDTIIKGRPQTQAV